MLGHQDRHNRLNRIIESGDNPYKDRFHSTHSLEEASCLEDGQEEVSLSGRVVFKRNQGKLLFGQIQDFNGRIQFSLRADTLSKEIIKFFDKTVDLGDFIGIKGTLWTTKTGQKTLNAQEYTLLTKAISPQPEKWHGVQDQELAYRKRYLDLCAAGNDESRKRFKAVLAIPRIIRETLNQLGFVETPTPILVPVASGAAANPFQTHHDKLGVPLYLRIAPETYLKRLLVAGIPKVYELGRCFRNEGMSTEHLQEFQMVEVYEAYANHKDTMQSVETLIKKISFQLFQSYKFTFRGVDYNLENKFKEINYVTVLEKATGINVLNYNSFQGLWEAISKKMSQDFAKELHPKEQVVGLGTLVDLLYKKTVRPNILGPAFLVGHPTCVSPLARQNDNNPKVADRYQLIIGGIEVVNGYSELADPQEQARKFEEQAKVSATDDEAVSAEDSFVEALTYGMPPASGWGMGIERLAMILTDAPSIRDVVLFPTMKPEEKD